MNTLAAEGAGAQHKEIDNYTPEQRFFICFRTGLVLEQHRRVGKTLARTDPHSPGKWRVNGTVQNFDEFGKAFGCKKGTPMYPEKSLPRLVAHLFTWSESGCRAIPEAGQIPRLSASSASRKRLKLLQFKMGAIPIQLCCKCSPLPAPGWRG